ncbi:MAG: hypothetical protein U9N46_13540 [Euryarchaeota archaeon]|nr:MAG: hypothetical protein C5S47_08275 [ANME-2 cluster archaeon]MEA1866185.1 hypothetical protein [Euryarchaeota archaeon]
MTQRTTTNSIHGGQSIEGEIIERLQLRDKDEIMDIPTLLMNERVDFERLVEMATGDGVLYEVLALIEIADCMEHKDEFEVVLTEHSSTNTTEAVLEDAIFPYSEFRRHIKRSFLEDIEERWNVRIAFTFDDFYKIYRDYHLLPYHGAELKRYFGDEIEI